MEGLDPISPRGLAVTDLFGFELVISALLLALVLGWMAIALVRFRRRPGDVTEPPQTAGHRTLEIVWTVTPALILAFVFVRVLQTMGTVNAQEPTAVQVRVIGHQFWWEFQYPDQQVVTANEFHVPVGSTLQLDLTSTDVIHSFWVPHFGYMRDAVPGRHNGLPVMADRAGVYDGACTQYCGLQHAWMRVRVVAEPADQFQTWLQQQSQPAAASSLAGQQVFLQNTCVSCHTIRGISTSVQVGPDLTHLASRATIAGTVADNTSDSLHAWIRDPRTLKPGVLMPAYPNLSSQDLDALVTYLQSLR